jgi:hypothetical protein
MKEIGLILGLAVCRVSQIHASAVLHLRARLSAPAPPEDHAIGNNQNLCGKDSII